MFYFKDENLQKEASRYHLSAEMKETGADYLMIVDTNIAGQKTDRVISKKVRLESEIVDDGQIVNTLTINREHLGQKNAVLVGVRNVNWLRIYVPKGSVFLDAYGFESPDPEYFDKADPDALILPELENEYFAKVDKRSGTLIYDEGDKTVFANWTMTDPGQNSEVVINYRLPYDFNVISQEEDVSWLKKIYQLLNPDEALISSYSLLWQKQPGAKAYDFELNIRLPEDYEIFWQAEENHNSREIEVKDSLNQDRFYGALIKKIK